MTHEEFMRQAIELSREKMRDGDGGPFAAIIVREGTVIGRGWNQVTSHNDPTAHAEVVAIRDACDRTGTYSLEGATIYSSCEPCPMCLAAIYWARISCVYYANAKADASAIGFDDEFLYRELALPWERRSLPGVRILAGEALEVFSEWNADPDKLMY